MSTSLSLIATFTIMMSIINTNMRDGRGRNLIAIPTIIPQAHMGTSLLSMTTIPIGHRKTSKDAGLGNKRGMRTANLTNAGIQHAHLLLRRNINRRFLRKVSFNRLASVAMCRCKENDAILFLAYRNESTRNALAK